MVDAVELAVQIRRGLLPTTDEVTGILAPEYDASTKRGPSWDVRQESLVALASLLALVEQQEKALRPLVTICRDCRERPADWLMWGKMLPEHQLGFKCSDCAYTAGLDDVIRMADMAAIIDCRPARAALSGGSDE